MTVPEKPMQRKEDLFRVKILAIHASGAAMVECTTYDGKRIVHWLRLGESVTFLHQAEWVYGDETEAGRLAAAEIDRIKR